MFIDQATIHVRAGRGGNGVISFRREKFIPKGGPDGGNGGSGGSVVIRADRQLTTLMDFRYRRNYAARDGENGMGAKKTGKSADDIVIKVPTGTLVMDAGSGKTLGDLIEEKQAITVARGGKGGRGNWEFATSTNQAPRIATPGTSGEERTIQLELKLLADVGLVGFPNAGKSTLISRISAARPKIADYPFTTLIPNLGIVRYGEARSFVVADMPGLIRGAHEGRGLGIQFLKHIERTKVLVFIIDVQEKIREQYDTLIEELGSFSKKLVSKPQIVAISKMDIKDAETGKPKFPRKIPVVQFSSVTGEGLDKLLELIWKKLSRKN